MAASHIWGLSSAAFLWSYGALCGLALIGVWLRRRHLLGAGGPTAAPRAFDAYELAMLNGGPQLVITIAAAQLHRIGSLGRGYKDTPLKVKRRPERTADGVGELEEEVFDAVLHNPGMAARSLRKELADCAPIRRMAGTLTEAGLLLDDRRRAALQRLWLWLVPLTALGIARVAAAGGDDGSRTAIAGLVLALAVTAVWLALQRPRATAQGRRLLDGERAGRKTLGRTPSQAEIPAAVALYGAGALWVADPNIASTWDVPREHGSALAGGGGRGCGAGGGACGAGGGACGAGHGGCGGGGSCGGGGG